MEACGLVRGVLLASGGRMATGTGGDYWRKQGLPSVHKHGLLRWYIPKFAGMTGSLSKRVVYVDGYAGEGRYADGGKGSAERAMIIAADHAAMKQPIQWTCFFAERNAESVEKLRRVADEYRLRGVDSRIRHGDVDGLLGPAVAAADGLPLFLFLDPCGLGLPFRRLVEVVSGPRNRTWPPTEFLLNFSMEAVRRIGGLLQSPHRHEKALARLDAVCGGEWWRDVITRGGRDADERVAVAFAERLATATGMSVCSVHVQRAPGHKAVYHLVFGTRNPRGLWAFGDAAARARDLWWKTLALREEEQQDALFPVASVLRPDPTKVTDEAIPVMAANIERLLAKHGAFALRDYTLEVFGDYYGQVTEPAARLAVKRLYQQGKTASTGVGGAPHELTVRPPA